MIKIAKQYGPEESVEDSFLRISTDLEYEISFKIEIHIYKDIVTFHKAIGMEQAPDWVIGTADENKIKIVSPLGSGGIPAHTVSPGGKHR